jgi:tetratricopeptide (TPR) repeat protein
MDSYQRVLTWRDRLAAAEKASKEGNRPKAELLYRQAMDISASLSEQEHVTSIIHLADFYGSGQEYERAEPLYRKAAELYERSFGPRNFIGAMCLRSLGDVLEALGKQTEAQSIKTRAMEILGTLR